MVQGKNEISILFDRDFLHHKFYDYLSFGEKRIVSDRIKNGKTIICGVYKNGCHLFCASFDIDNRDLLHCRDVAGNFGRNLQHLLDVATILAKGLKKDFITVNATKPAVEKFCKRLGFEHVHEQEFQKVLN
jgi:hypothetical protein